jgi:transcriptional regulator with XRE-family HTH domain
MPRGVPSRIQAGTIPQTYTMREIADGVGMSVSLISRVMRGERPISEYLQPRLAEFFGVTIEQLRTPGTITAQTPPVRHSGRVVYKIHRPSY